MEDLIQKLDEIKEVLNANSVPFWLTVFCMIVPIAISLAVAVFAIIQHCQNKRLQNAISDKELKVQMHGDILRIYDDHSLAQQTLGKTGDNIASIFSYPNSTNQWSNDLINAANLVCSACNRAELLLPKSDKQLREVLFNLFKKFESLCQKVNGYNNSGMADSARQQTWKKINKTYSIPINDYNSLSGNIKATEDFIKLCSNNHTKKMDDDVKEILDLYDYDKFDKYFEQYLRMYSEEK